jgi:hypothetical protein
MTASCSSARNPLPEIDFLDGRLQWAGQDVGHGYIYDSYPLDRVRALLAERAATSSPKQERSLK